MYLLNGSIDRAADWYDQVKLKLKHDLTHGGDLDECYDWDQQAHKINGGIPLCVIDDKYGQGACDVKREPPEVEKRKAEAAQASGEKQKLTVQEPTPQKKKT